MIFTVLPCRKLLSVTGQDSFRFLQGLISSDLSLLESSPKSLLKALFLGSDGRIHSDGLISKRGNAYFVETGTGSISALTELLKRRKLGSRVDYSVVEDQHVYGKVPIWLLKILRDNVANAEEAKAHQSAYEEYACDTSLLGRAYSKSNQAEITTDFSAEHRLYLALNGFALTLVKDLRWLKALPQDMKLHQMGFVSSNKGCYVGQEIMNRILNRTLMHKYRLKYLIGTNHLDHTTSDNADLVPEIQELGLTRSIAKAVGIPEAANIVNKILTQGTEELHQVVAENKAVPIVYYKQGFGLALCLQRGDDNRNVVIDGMEHLGFLV